MPDRYLEILKQLVLSAIDKERYAVFLFGSRARGKEGKGVDVDIGILGDGPFSLDALGDLHAAIDDSIVPYKVDIVDFYRANEKFKEIALSDIEIWTKPSTIDLNETT